MQGTGTSSRKGRCVIRAHLEVLAQDPFAGNSYALELSQLSQFLFFRERCLLRLFRLICSVLDRVL